MEEELKPRFGIFILYILSTFVFFVPFGYFMYKGVDELDLYDLLPIAIILVCTTPFVILPVTYLYSGLSKRIFIDKDKRQLRIREKRKDLYIVGKDVMKSYRVYVDKYRGRRFFRDFEYVLIVLAERKRIFIPSLLCKPEEIVSLLSLNTQDIDMYIPFLDPWLGMGVLKQEEFNMQVLKYKTLFHEFPKNKLRAIIHNHKDYTATAREAARQILKEVADTKRKGYPHSQE